MNEANSSGVLNNAETVAKVAAMAANSARNELSHDLNRKLGIVRRVSSRNRTRIGRGGLIDRIAAHHRKGSISRIVRTGMTAVGTIGVEMDARGATRIFEEISVQISEANSGRNHVRIRVENHVPKREGNFVRNRVRMCVLIRARSMTILLRKMSRVLCGRMIICRRRARSTLLNCRRCRWST